MTTWLVKQEPGSYPFARLLEERRTRWDGVRNFQARNNLQSMSKGDRVLYYHSGGEKAVVGLARVARPAYPDPTSDDPRWVAVDLEAVGPLERPVPLSAIKADPVLKGMELVRLSRLSVMPVAEHEAERILELGGTGPPSRKPRRRA